MIEKPYDDSFIIQPNHPDVYLMTEAEIHCFLRNVIEAEYHEECSPDIVNLRRITDYKEAKLCRNLR